MLFPILVPQVLLLPGAESRLLRITYFYVMYIRVINIKPPSGGMNAVPVAVAGGRD